MHALVADHEHVGAALLGQAHQHVPRIALVDQGAAVEPVLAQVGLGALELLVEPGGRAEGLLDLARGAAEGDAGARPEDVKALSRTSFAS